MFRNYTYIVFCSLHRLAKKLLRKQTKEQFRMVKISPNSFSENGKIDIKGPYINEIEIKNSALIDKENLFPIENIVDVGTNLYLKDSYQKQEKTKLKLGVHLKAAKVTWQSFIDASLISKGYKNEGLSYTAYISDDINQWALPSWIWTNAALVRMYCKIGNIKKAKHISDLLIKQQLECGGWIVRNDYEPNGAIPTLAPNDSAYIANNALIEVYKITNEKKYIEAAIKCADWIIKTAREDSLVWTGFDMKNEKWMQDHIIVDTGFAAGLFANLYEILGDIKYKQFLEKFIKQYIKLFYIKSKKGFCTSINKNNKQGGGMFARGQAWALEGLIPTYKVLKCNDVKKVIEETVNNLIKEQLPNGGWAYNFSKPLLGEDCKGVSVIAKSLMDWNKINNNHLIVNSTKKALEWCANHTSQKDESKGGIFSFCMEGAVVHNFYTSTAFVYSSAYAIETLELLNSNS